MTGPKRSSILLAFLLGLPSGSIVAAQPGNDEGTQEPEAETGEQRLAAAPYGFFSSRSVSGTLAQTKATRRAGSLEALRAKRDALEARTGLSFGIDNNTQYLGTDSNRSPSDAAGNVFRIFGTWTASGRGTADTGALVFKLEDRSAIGDRLSPQGLGPSLGYAGLLSTTFSDAGVVLTNLYWQQRFARGRGAFVLGQVDASDYISVNSVANPWTAFTNLAFEQQPALALPSQGLGAAVQWRLNDQWQVLAGFADANGDPSEPWESAKDAFESGEWFKHFALGWSPDWDDRYDQSVQLTFWQADERVDAGVDGGHGFAVLASARIESWRPFVRAAYGEDAGLLNDRSISIGTGYDARDGKDLAGLAVNWARAPDSDRDQYTLEAFYRYDLTDYLQISPEIQYVIDPALEPEADDVLVLGARLRLVF